MTMLDPHVSLMTLLNFRELVYEVFPAQLIPKIFLLPTSTYSMIFIMISSGIPDVYVTGLKKLVARWQKRVDGQNFSIVEIY